MNSFGTSNSISIFFCFPKSHEIRSANVETRQRYVKLCESVKESGGQVRIFSSLHVSGERNESNPIFLLIWIELAQLTGIAAILRFPLPDIAEEEEDEPEEDDEDDNSDQQDVIIPSEETEDSDWLQS